MYRQVLAGVDRKKGYLTDTCLSAQDAFKKYLGYFIYRMKTENLTYGSSKAVREVFCNISCFRKERQSFICWEKWPRKGKQPLHGHFLCHCRLKCFFKDLIIKRLAQLSLELKACCLVFFRPASFWFDFCAVREIFGKLSEGNPPILAHA